MLGPAAPDNLLHILEIRALSVDDLSTARYVVGTAFARGQRSITRLPRSTPSPSSCAARTMATCCSATVPTARGSARRWWVLPLGASAKRRARRHASSPCSCTRCSAATASAPGSPNTSRTRRARAGYRALETSATINSASFFERLDYLEVRRGAWGLPSGRADAHRLHAQDQRRPPRHHALTISSGGAAEQPGFRPLASDQRQAAASTRGRPRAR